MTTETHKVAITNGTKIMFPNSGITKQQLYNYYDKIANYMLPYLRNRPLTMQRFPRGINEEGFFQKNASDYFPKWISTIKVKKKDGWVNHIVCNNKETFLYLVNQYVLTFHVALSKSEKIYYPDKLVFDLDPPKGDFKLAVKAAKALRYLLEEELQLKTFVMTSGSEGLHIVVPLKADKHFDEVHEFAKKIANYISNRNSKEFTTAVRKNKRKGRLYIDSLRNSYAQTSVAPYSIRAFENAPIATPLYWQELDNPNLNAQFYTIKTIRKKIETQINPWENFEASAKNISDAIKKLEILIS